MRIIKWWWFEKVLAQESVLSQQKGFAFYFEGMMSSGSPTTRILLIRRLILTKSNAAVRSMLAMAANLPASRALAIAHCKTIPAVRWLWLAVFKWKIILLDKTVANFSPCCYILSLRTNYFVIGNNKSSCECEFEENVQTLIWQKKNKTGNDQF